MCKYRNFNKVEGFEMNKICNCRCYSLYGFFFMFMAGSLYGECQFRMDYNNPAETDSDLKD